MVTGGTGAIGRPLVERLLARGHDVRALVRTGSVGRLPRGAQAIPGDALDARSVAAALRPGDTLVHLVGTPHPNPAKGAAFERVDLASIRASVAAASDVGIAHLVYVSVAQPAPVMKAYVAVRARGQALIADARLTATIVRPWYVLGPGHRWPLLLLPLYALASVVPATRERAERLGLVTLDAMVTALMRAVETPPEPGTRRIVDVPAIRTARLA